MTTLTKVLVVVAVMGLATGVLAKGAGGGGKAAGRAAKVKNADPSTSRFSEIKGLVSKVEDGKITLTVTQKGAAADVVVATSDKTIVVVPKVAAATVKDVTAGMTLEARIADGVAVWIDAKMAKAGKAGKTPEAPAPAPAPAPGGGAVPALAPGV